MSENLQRRVESEDDLPQSALSVLAPHLRRFAELRETTGKTLEECVEEVRPGFYGNPRDAGWRWAHRKDVQAAMAELRTEAIKKAARGAADVLSGMWEVHDRCLQRVAPKLNRKGENVMTETATGGEALAYEFDANGAMRALESLAEYHKLTKKQVEVSGPNGEPLPAAGPVLHLTVVSGDTGVESRNQPFSPGEAESGVPQQSD